MVFEENLLPLFGPTVCLLFSLTPLKVKLKFSVTFAAAAALE